MFQQQNYQDSHLVVGETAPHIYWKVMLDIACSGMVRAVGCGSSRLSYLM